MEIKAYDKNDWGTHDKREERTYAKCSKKHPGGKGPQHDKLAMGDIEDSGNSIL